MAPHTPHDFKAFMARTLEAQPTSSAHPAAPAGPVVLGGHVSMMVRGNVYFLGDMPDATLRIVLGSATGAGKHG